MIEKMNFFLALFLVFSSFFPSLEKKRMIMFGIDAVAARCIQNATRNKTFQFLMENGAYSLYARTVIEAKSAVA